MKIGTRVQITFGSYRGYFAHITDMRDGRVTVKLDHSGGYRKYSTAQVKIV